MMLAGLYPLVLVILSLSADFSIHKNGGIGLTRNEEMRMELLSPKITLQEKDNPAWYGTGTITAIRSENRVMDGKVRKCWVTNILTAKHIIADSKVREGKITITIPIFLLSRRIGFRTIPAEVVRISDKYDMAMLAVVTHSKPLSEEPAIFLTGAVSENCIIHLCGSSKGVQGTIADGVYIPGSYQFPMHGSPNSAPVVTTLLTSCITDQGASGAAFFTAANSNRFAVGMLTHVISQGVPGSFGLTSNEIREFAVTEGLEYAFRFSSESTATSRPTKIAATE